MFLSEIVPLDCKEGRKITKLARESSTFNAFYEYWRDNLFERIMRLFIWDGTGSVPVKEIEQRLHLQGHCAISTLPKETELTAFFGNFYGVSKYMDERPYYNVRCPIYAGQRTVGRTCAVIDNNSLRNPTIELVHHYAILLGHTEVTYIDTMVNARDSGGIPVASNEKQKQSIIDYQGKIFNGQYGVVADMGALGVNYAGTDRRTNQGITDIWAVRNRILKDFYADIGIRATFDKRSNTVEAEIIADTSMLLLNISDMLNSREKGAEAVNKLYGTNWTVKLSDEIKYNEENKAEGVITNA